MLVTFVTGSIHCFSVFLVPFEARLNLPRADISLFYSFALIFLTISVLFGYLIYDRIKPAKMLFVSCVTAGLGLIVSAFANTWWSVFIGYSIGIGNLCHDIGSSGVFCASFRSTSTNLRVQNAMSSRSGSLAWLSSLRMMC